MLNPTSAPSTAQPPNIFRRRKPPGLPNETPKSILAGARLRVLVLRLLPLDFHVRGNKLGKQLRTRGELVASKIKQRGEGVAVREPRPLVPELVEEDVAAPLEWTDPPLRIVRERARYEVHGVLGRLRPENLPPLAGLDLREFELGVVRVHAAYLLPRGGAEDLDDLDELVDARVAGEEGLAEQELGADAPLAPDVDARGVVGAAEDELGRPVVPAADVADVGLAPDEGLGAPEVAELELLVLGVDEEVLRLDVAVTYAEGVDVGQGTR
mmetsp:Transcript_11405/g.26005  ORF Transcript_11405/g.26005 Transcript_11405/m.26005 type:complete len:269 (+) Transcript_11405:215-1021(+)